MSETEHRLADTVGRITKAVEGGSDVTDPAWRAGRILLSNRRLIIVGTEGKRTIPLSAIDGITGRDEVNRGIEGITNYSRLHVGDEVLLVATQQHREFELALCQSLLDDSRVLVGQPAVDGDVVTEPDWVTGRVGIGEDGTVTVTTADGGDTVSIEPSDVVAVTAKEREVDGDRVAVVEVEHTETERSVETHLGGPDQLQSCLEVLFAPGLGRNGGNVELGETEKQILMALYSGISPFEIPEFTGLDVDETERTYARLIENGVLEEIRRRREVSLTSRGRNLASEAMNEE